MNLLFRVVYAHGCRSTHHKFALDALTHLRGPQAPAWRRFFLKYHSDYLLGAKAPDTDFRDFRNHVLHVRDNNWGGAPKAARKWYDLAVVALQERRWAVAAYCLGVLSHYYTDVIHPFHTGQSQAESNVHRACEWSIVKSYRAIYDLTVANDLFPDITIPDGDDWVEQLVLDGAEASNVHYEALIEHYDMARGVRQPPAGLDDTSREILSHLFGHAIAGTGRLIERAVAEADVRPPDVNLTLEAFLATIKVPIAYVAKQLADVRERRLVRAMYRELKETGQVDTTLPEDDRTVRDLYRRECAALKVSSETASSNKGAATAAASGRETRNPKTVAKTSSERPPRFYLETTDDVVEAPSIGPKTARRLAAAGIRTVEDLFNADPYAVAAQVKARHITPDVVRDWQDQARLVCRIPRLRGHDAQILVACDCRSVDEVACADARALWQRATEFAATSAGERVLRGGTAPDLAEVEDWIAWSQSARPLRAA